MTTAMPEIDPVEGAAATLAALGRHWGLLLTFGVLSVIAGLAAVFWPGPTFVVVAVFFGVWLLVSGIFQVVQAFGSQNEGGRALLAVAGVCGIVLGLLCFRGPLQAAYILLLLIAFGWITRGIMTLVAGFSAKGMPGRGWLIFGGIVLVIGGVVMLVVPIDSAKVLAVVSGLFLILFGVMEIVAAFQARKLAA